MDALREVRLGFELRRRSVGDAGGRPPVLPPGWWLAGRALDAVLGSLAARNLWFGFDRCRVDDEWRAAADAAAAKALAPAAPGGELLLAADDGRRRSYARMDLYRGSFKLVLRVRGADLDARRERLLRDLVGFVADVRVAFDLSRWELAWQGDVVADDFAYPRVRPPRSHPFWTPGALVNFIEPATLAAGTDDEQTARDVTRLLASGELPPGASRETREGLEFFLWAADLADDRRVADALAAQERWTAETLRPPIEEGWTEEGDRLVVHGRLAERPPLTFYDPAERHGYLAIAAGSDGACDAAALSEAAQWGRAGRLPDGTPLAELDLVVTARPAALALFRRGLPEGVRNVLYLDGPMRLWNPFPPGLWAN